MSGNGLSIDDLSSSSKFLDLAGDGYATRTAWAGQGNGVLVLDADGDGKISRSNEFAFTEWDSTAKTDFEALKHVFDTNGNGKLDAGDARWSEFRVEVNGQLVTLDSLGITSIDLTPTGSGQSFADGSAITGTTTFTRSDGTTGIAGDAMLAVDGNKYIIRTTSATQANGSVAKDILGYNADGRLAFHEVVTTSADGNLVTTQFDDDGNGTFDRSQTIATSVATDGVRSKVVSNVNADGSLADRTTTVTSADLKTVTTSLDQDGDGVIDERQVFIAHADGSSTTTTQSLSLNGTVLQQVVIEATADGLTKTSTVDLNADGNDDLVVSETTVVAADGTRTKTVDTRAIDGTLLSQTVTTSSADNKTITIADDEDGNGTVDSRSVTVTTVAASGDITAETTVSNGDDSLRSKSITVTSADGLSKTVSSDVTGDGNIDVVDSDITVVSADGTRTQTVQQVSGNGTLLSKTVTTTSADLKTISIATDANGDHADDSLTSITIAADGTTTKTVTALNADGSLVNKTTAITSADGLSKTTTVDADGIGNADRIVTDVITGNPDGSRTETVTVKSYNGTVLSTTVTKTTADSLSQTVRADLNGDGTVDQVASDTITLGADGSRTETVSVKSTNDTLQQQTTTVVSADRQTTTVTTDADGDGHLDSRQVKTVFADGRSETVRTDYAVNGAVLSTRTDTVSADGLTKTSSVDINGGGDDRVISDQTVLGTDGSRTETISLTTGDGKLLDRKTILTSGNGLSVTTSEDVNGDGNVDLKTTDVSTLNADGSVNTAVSHYRGTTRIDRTSTTTSANGLSTSTVVYADGDATIDRRETSTRTLNADGSTQTVEVTRAGDGTLISKATTAISADGKSATKTFDLDGNSSTDAQEKIAVNDAGVTTDTVETYKADGTLESRSVTTTSANGLSRTSKSDLNGDNTFEKAVIDVTTLEANGGQTRVVSESVGGVQTAKTTLTTSGNGLTKTATWADGSNTTVRSMEDVTVLNVDGGTAETVSYFKPGGGLESRTVTTVVAHGLSTTVELDLDGDGNVDQRTVTKKQDDGWVKQVMSDLTTGGIVTDTKTVTISADGLHRTVDYDTDGNNATDKQVTDVTVLNADGSRTTTTEELTAGVLKSRTVVDTSADGLSVTTHWDTTGVNSFDKSEIDVTVLNADGSRSRTVSIFNGTPLASRHLIETSANGLVIIEQWDLTGSGTYGQSARDETVLNADGTTTRTVTATNADGTLISKTVATTDASGRVVSSSDERPGFGNQTRSNAQEVLADGTIRQTATTSDSSSHLLDKTVTTTSGDKLTVTVERDANGDGIIDQRQQSVTANSGILTSTTTDFNADGTTVRDRSVRTVSADGRHTEITWDYDGNGTNERQRKVDDVVHADGSRTTVMTDTDLATGKLAAKTTVQVSADGKTVTTSKDVNGDGTDDQLETVTIDATGATKSVVTNNATARSASYLTAGGVYWTQAIAAKSETTTSIDGRSKTIRYDYDGDGVFEVTMQSVRQVDGSIVTSVTETGATVATGTISTSADGLITKLVKDTGNNGSTDHTETSVTHADGSVTLTKVDFNAGTLTQSVVDTVNTLGSLTLRVTSDGQGRKTSQVTIATDGSSETTAFDAASGQPLSITRANKAGILTSATLYDPLNAQPWSRVEQQFDATGKKVSEVQYKDDGTRAEITFTATGDQQQIKFYSATNILTGTTEFDTANANTWTKVEKTYDAKGQVTVQVTTNDDATKVQINYDRANAQTWSTYQQNFDAGGHPTFIDQANDNGTHNTVTYDVANTQTWSRYEQYKDSAGRLVTQTNYYDNGTKNIYSYDPTNAQTWSTYIQSYNAAGQRTAVDQTNDNGTRYRADYDPTNAQVWSSIQRQWAANGKQTSGVQYNDNGTLIMSVYDLNGVLRSRITDQHGTGLYEEFNANGVLMNSGGGGGSGYVFGSGFTFTTQVNADGSMLAQERDSAGHVVMQRSSSKSGTTRNVNITFWDSNGKVVSQSYSSYGGAIPVLLDLNHDGHIDLRPLDTAALAGGHGPTFAWDPNLSETDTAWVGPQDGFLAIDLGGDGLIDQAKELSFGSWATEEQIAANGGDVSDLDGLRLVFDSNHDNVLDANDDRWSEFRVWRDTNQNGITDAGELQTMSEAGIKLVNLLHTPEGSQAFADGSSITGTSSYETVTGEKLLVADATLAYRAA
ncbi:adhesin [Rhizobium sp. R693]|nr:adhesin [Rhizobium sp. R693]